MCLPVDSVFEFSQIGHHGGERWSFSKEHLSPVSVIDSNLREVFPGVARYRAPQLLERKSFLRSTMLARRPNSFTASWPYSCRYRWARSWWCRESRGHVARMEDGME